MDVPTTSTAPWQVDFLVVGAGPVGLVSAILLGRQGWRVVVIERWPVRYPMPRACTIDHEALRILRAVGVKGKHGQLFEPSRGERGGYQVRNGAGLLLRQIDWNRPAESGWANTHRASGPGCAAASLAQRCSDPGSEAIIEAVGRRRVREHNLPCLGADHSRI